MPRLTDQAICLRDLDWSETSQLVVLLTRDHGIVRGLAKGARRQSPSAIARFSGGINLLCRGEAVVTTKPAGQLAAVTEWDLQDDHHHLRTSLPAQWSAMYAADLTAALLAEEDPHPGAFAALSELIAQLREPSNQTEGLLRFQWSMLSEAGYRPELDHDVAGGGALGRAKAYSFDPVLGGLTQRNGINDERWRVRHETVALLRKVAKGEAIDSRGDQAITRANRLLCTYARSLLDKELPTMKLILQDQLSELINRTHE